MKAVLWIAPLALIFTGCSSVINKPVVLDSQPPTSLSLDGKQRLVVVVDRGPVWDKRRALCAEPSPDALTGIAASVAASANVQGKVDAKVAASLAEAVQTVGRRTQTIQLLRDGLYRACEAYINGALTEKEYRLLLSRIDDFAITLVAIDGLTGGLNVPVTALRPTTSGAAGDQAQSDGNGAAKDQPAKPGATTAASGGDAPQPTINVQVSNEIALVVKDIVTAFLAHHLDMNKSDLEGATKLVELEQQSLTLEITQLQAKVDALKEEAARREKDLKTK